MTFEESLSETENRTEKHLHYHWEIQIPDSMPQPCVSRSQGSKSASALCVGGVYSFSPVNHSDTYEL